MPARRSVEAAPLAEAGQPSDLSELLGPDADRAAGELRATVETILRGLAGRYRPAREQFEDLVQQAMVVCVREAQRMARGEKPPLKNRDAWLVRVTRNLVLTACRRVRKDQVMDGWPEGFEPPAPKPMPPEERLTLRRALAELDAVCRRLLVLRDVMGEARSAIAEQLEITSNALGVKLHRCRRRLLELYMSLRPA